MEYGLKFFKVASYVVLGMTAMFLILNQNYGAPGYLAALGVNVRIGLEISVLVLIQSLLLENLLRRWNHKKYENLTTSIKFRFGTGVPMMLVGLVVTSEIEKALFGFEMGNYGLRTGFFLGAAIFGGVLIFSAYRESVKKNLQLRAESAEANLHVLRNQMQPHFLFNSLNTLAELIDSKSSSAAEMTQKLSDLYREILEASKLQSNSLNTEASIVRKYLELEALRFGKRLSYEIALPPNAENIFIPSLMLQTLVENAVKHGISQRIEGGKVDLVVQPDSATGYVVEIKNSSAGKLKGERKGAGVVNTISRLQLHYGDRHGFRLEVGPIESIARFWFSGVSLG